MIFNIGPLEFILILLVAIIVLGPERMVTGARSLGRWIYKLVRSPTWRSIMSTSLEIRDLPNKIMRESGLEESLKEVQSVSADLNSEISQAVKDVNDEVSQAASAVSAEVSQAVKEVNAELKQSSQAAGQAAGSVVTEANQGIPAANDESQAVPAESMVPAGAPLPTEASAPEVEAAQTEAAVPVELPVLVMQDISAAEPANLSNNGHSEESSPESAVVESATLEFSQAPVAPLAPKTVEADQPEEDLPIQPPQSPAAHINIE